MECPRCHAPVSPGSLYCPACNSPLSDEAPTVAVSVSTPIPLTPAVVTGSVRGSASIGPGAALGGRYEILQVLGEGGMGVVYKARDRELDRVIALKVIRPGLASNPDIVARFKQELLLARQVTHKNVIRIFDLSEAEGLKFITMEYVEGLNLKAFITQATKLPAEDATQIIKQVCQALLEAHEEGVVHRDLKPQNIMVDSQGRVKVMDFGLARSAELSGLTQTGGILGTPDYMSPEQVKGEEADARSDLFSLGIVFYELLTGRMPFQANTPYATLWKRVNDRAVPPAKLDPSVSAQLSQIVAKCLEPDPESRYQSAAEILRDLEAGTAPRPLLGPGRLTVLRRLGLSPRMAAVGIVVLGLVLAGALWGTTEYCII
jgi:eukaryotic-like serine/threonine-protein kinase